MNRRHPLPAEVYALVEQTPATVLLECGNRNNQEKKAGDCTLIFAAPVRVCAVNDAAEMAGLFSEIETAVENGLTAAGYFTYECGACFEPKAGMRPSQPLAWFGIYERAYRFDHSVGAFLDGEPPGLERMRSCGHMQDATWSIDAELGLNQAEYAKRIAAIHEWIRAGDVYQLNFTVPYQVRLHGGAAAMYAALRVRQPVEYGAFIHSATGAADSLVFARTFFSR